MRFYLFSLAIRCFAVQRAVISAVLDLITGHIHVFLYSSLFFFIIHTCLMLHRCLTKINILLVSRYYGVASNSNILLFLSAFVVTESNKRKILNTKNEGSRFVFSNSESGQT